MIGRTENVRPFDLLRWAREAAVDHELKLLEAHVLLLLATYANGDCVAWPSIKTLAERSGLKVRRAQSKRRDGSPGGYYYVNSSVSAALRRLEELALVWSTQGGHGRPTKRELLYNPALPSGQTEGNGAATPPADKGQPSCLPVSEPSCLPEQKDQEEGASLSTANSRNGQIGSLPASRKASHPADRKAGDDLHKIDVLASLGIDWAGA